jgi:hypothetical protein
MNQFLYESSWTSICHFLIVDPHIKAMGPIYGYYQIELFYLIGPLTLDFI